MLTFKRPTGSYRYFAYEDGKKFYLQGLWVDGIRSQHNFPHEEYLTSTLEDHCKKHCKDAIDFEEIDTEPGVYHPRIWKGPLSPCDLLASLNEETRTVVAVSVLVRRLKEIFRFVEPTQNNDKVYSHEIRSLLLLAAMEVESSLAAVLRANGYRSSRQGYKIADYIKLKGPMFLEGYRVTLQSYPDYPPIRPFKDWDVKKPAQTLSWWQDYNSTKHDRDTEFSKGSFKQALYAVSAAVLLLAAQFGTLTGRRRVGKDVAAEFNVEPARDFPDDYPDDFFYVPRQGQPWQMKKLTLK